MLKPTFSPGENPYAKSKLDAFIIDIIKTVRKSIEIIIVVCIE